MISGDNVTLVLNGLKITPAKFNHAMQTIGYEMRERVHDNFENESSPYGVPWVRSKRAERDDARNRRGKTLQDTRSLYESITYNVLPYGVEWGTNVVYAGVHNYGFVSVDRVIPQRQFLGFTESDALFVVDTIAEVIGFE